jgi:hypothetical protein
MRSGSLAVSVPFADLSSWVVIDDGLAVGGRLAPAAIDAVMVATFESLEPSLVRNVKVSVPAPPGFAV